MLLTQNCYFLITNLRTYPPFYMFLKDIGQKSQKKSPPEVSNFPPKLLRPSSTRPHKSLADKLPPLQMDHFTCVRSKLPVLPKHLQILHTIYFQQSYATKIKHHQCVSSKFDAGCHDSCCSVEIARGDGNW